jgi:lichenan operon transcriptional antiterminator
VSIITKTNPLLAKYELNDSEISYITLYIQTAIERRPKTKKSNCLIVCGTGVSTSRLVEVMLDKRFKDGLKVVKTVSYATMTQDDINHSDFIVTTIPIPTQEIPVIEVDFLRMERSFKEISDIISGNQKLNYHINANDIHIHPKMMASEQEAIQFLINHSSIDHDLRRRAFESALSREALCSTNISQYIAIPHIVIPEIERPQIVVLSQTSPISWGDSHVNTVFILLAKDNNPDEFRNFFQLISNIVDSKQVQEKLVHATSKEAFIKILEGMTSVG